MFEHIKTIFFDYDGTLHNSSKIYAPAFQRGYEFLVEQGYAKSKDWTEEEISHWLGYNSKEMWNTFMPSLEDEVKSKASNIIGKEMLAQVEKGNARLYPGTIEVLSYLKKKGYHLVFISNCKTSYRNEMRDHFGLDRYFDEMLTAEEHDYIPKYEILEKALSKYPKDRVIIGDRKHDMQAGKKNDIYTIGCSYGFSKDHELEEADRMINDIKELIDIF